MTPEEKAPPPDEDRQLGSPYGPQPHGVDEASGGADNSPFENLFERRRRERLRQAREQDTPGEARP